MTQRDRVLNALRNAGPYGICAVDFLAPNVIDGGKPITRVAARVHELREEGHPIVNHGRRNECDVYVLHFAQPAPVRATPAVQELAALFDLEAPAAKPASPYDDVAA